MLRTTRYFVSVSLLIISSQLCAVISHFSPRSQSVNAARDYVGLRHFLYIPDQDKLYGAINLTFEYQRSFNGEDIANCLFGNAISCKKDCGSEIAISGSIVENRGANDWLAEYAGLATDFQSTIFIKPQINNFIIDFGFFLGLDEFVPGLYFSIHLPFVHTRWDLNLKERITEKGTDYGLYPAGYFTPSEVPATSLLKSYSDFVNGKVTNNAHNTDGRPNLPNNVKFNELCCSKLSTDCGPLKKSGVAELRTVLGYSLTHSPDYHVGIGLLIAAPTGTRPNGSYLFEPVVGNGKHWELGGQLVGQYTFWNSIDGHSHASFNTVANLTHMFKAKQKRCFDLCNQPASRYMLASKFSAPANYNLKGDGVAACEQFQAEYSPLANITQSDVKVSVGLQLDALFALSIVSQEMSFDIGYNVWARTCEKIKIRTGCTPDTLDNKSWGLKGNAFMYGFENHDLSRPVPLSATQRGATIHDGTNDGLDDVNTGIDNAQKATGDFTDMNANNPLYSGSSVMYDQVNTSIQAVLLSEQDLDLSGTKGLSHKLFMHVSYTWLNNEDWTPFFGFGAEVEFGQNDEACKTPIITKLAPSSCKTVCCDNCVQCSLSQWGVWVKGGFAFN